MAVPTQRRPLLQDVAFSLSSVAGLPKQRDQLSGALRASPQVVVRIGAFAGGDWARSFQR